MVKRDFWACGHCQDFFSSAKPRMSLAIIPATSGVPTLVGAQYETWLCEPCAKGIRDHIEHQPKPTGWQPKHHE